MGTLLRGGVILQNYGIFIHLHATPLSLKIFYNKQPKKGFQMKQVHVVVATLQNQPNKIGMIPQPSLHLITFCHYTHHKALYNDHAQ